MPIYVCGRVDPVSFSRGKRGLAGSLVFTNFDRGALYAIDDSETGVDFRYYKKTFDIPAGGKTTDLETTGSKTGALSTATRANYPDQLPPFNINITAANEYGQSMMMGIFGVELLNQGQGVSVDDMSIETQFTFVARSIVDWQPKPDSLEAGRGSISEVVNNTQSFNAALKTSGLDTLNATDSTATLTVPQP